MIAFRAVRRAARYEATRLATRRSTLGVAGLAVFGAALITLPAARVAVTSAVPQSRIGWVVEGGSIGATLPATAAVLAAAWLGAGLVTEDYRFGLGLSTYSRLPRRGSGLAGKVVIAGGVGLLLAVVTRVAAFLTALGGFALAHSTTGTPSTLGTSGITAGTGSLAATGSLSPAYVLALPSLKELLFAVLGGAVGVLCAPLLRLRLLAVTGAFGLCALLAALAPGSHSPYTLPVVRFLLTVGLPVTPTALLVPELVLGVLVCSALLAVRRRRVE